MVVDTLEPMDVSRRAYRLVGGVLVERTVGEVLPTVKANQEGIKQLLQQLGMTRANKEKEAAEWKVYRYMILGMYEQRCCVHSYDASALFRHEALLCQIAIY